MSGRTSPGTPPDPEPKRHARMSTVPTEPTPDTTPVSTSEGTLANVEATETETEPGFVARHTTTLITVMVAVIVAAAAIAGVALYKNNVDEANADTEAAFAETVASQGAEVETIECDGGTCAAVINGQAYTVLVQEDEDGEQHFGISAYSGD
jgi:hypothetical protein